MIDPVTMNARKPQDDVYGNAMLERMNGHHAALYQWGLSHVSLEHTGTLLDIGFGGGQNLYNLSVQLPEAQLYGIDYSGASCKKCAAVNAEAVQSGRMQLTVGSAENLPYADSQFDLVTAFETTYYWPGIAGCFAGVRRILKNGGVFLICNEDSSPAGNETIAEALKMEFYDGERLRKLLTEAGFSKIRIDAHENGRWIAAAAEK